MRAPVQMERQDAPSKERSARAVFMWRDYFSFAKNYLKQRNQK